MVIESPPDTSLGRNALAVLAALPLFEDMDASSLIDLAEEIQWFGLPGGVTLFEEGAEADALYIVTSGALGAFRKDRDGRPRLIGRICQGETVGEMALLSGQPRSASIRALRDSELMRLSKSTFNVLATQHPSAMLRLARLTVERLETSLRQHKPRLAQKTFAVLPADTGVDAAGFARSLTTALNAFGRTELFTRESVGQHTSVWFNEIEARRDYVVYLADPGTSTWTSQCMRQADTLLMVADAKREETVWSEPAMQDAAVEILPRTELVLLHRRLVRPGAAASWLDRLPVAMHHHVCRNADIERVARLISGNAVGLVLSGGGARGFAHIGVVKALRQAGIPIDLVAGTSIGSIIAAGVAAGWDNEQLSERHRRSFVDANPLSDYTLPLISLVSGRKVTRMIRREVGTIDIEDLPLPFFCVSSNLTSGQTAVHRSGALWRWLRASVAIPGILPPVFHRRQIYVDGGIMNHLPVDVMRDLGRGPVIGVDVGADRKLAACEDVDELSLWRRFSLVRSRQAPDILQLLLRAGTVTSSGVTAANRAQSDIVLTPELDDVDMLNWQAFDRAIEAGFEHTLQRLDDIRDVLAPADHSLVC